MTSSVKLLAHPLLHALGWTLIHFCWQGAAIAVVLWCVLGVLAGRSPRLRYAAACLAMALMVALPTATFARLAVANYRAGRITWIADSESDGALVFAAGAQEIAQPWTARAVAQIDQWMPWLLAAWFAGAIFFVARLNYGLILARRLKCDDTCEPPSDLARRFDELRRRLGIERAVRLLHSPRVEVPTVIGWLRPVVLIPVSCLTGLSTEQIEAIFCHELAHVRRHDYLISVFQSVAETLLFYHPAVWWVSQQVRRERECCCDEVAVANSGDVLAYARALSHLEERRAAAPEFVLGANGGVLAMRIKRLVGAKDDVQTSQVASAVLLALMLAGAAGYAATEARAQMRAKVAALHNEPVLATESGQLLALNEAPPAFRMMSAAAQADATQQGGLHGIYKSWLDEDVVYIITPQEREAYLNLTNDDERDAFITQFWARRDAPGAPAGSFREQHYARIAYANEHFASDTQVGWRTDRGRIYIVNGKPYEIDSHPSGGEFAGVARSDPFEIWHYRGAKPGDPDVYVRFVDESHDGNYRLIGQAPQPIASSGNQSAQVRLQQDSSELQGGASGSEQGPVRIAAGVVAGQMEHVVPPLYPPEAKAQHVQGVVVLHAILSKTGEVENLQVISGPPLLTKAAIDAVSRWKYKPYLLNGQPTEVETTINVNFTFGNANSSAPPPPASDSEQMPPLTGAIRVSAGVMAAARISAVPPVYPPIAKAANVQGVVVLRAVISANGDVENLQAVSGPPMLIAAAIEAVKQWKYRPYLLNGEPREVETIINVNFSLGDSPQAQSGGPITAPAEYDGEPLRRIGGSVSVPMVIYRVDPEFSEQARAAKFNGTVLVNLIVDRDGLPQNVHVLRGVGMGLDEKAVEAVRQYRFKPAMDDGNPVPVALNAEINFQIFDKPKDPASNTPTNSQSLPAQTPAAQPQDTYPGLMKMGNGVSPPEVTRAVPAEYTMQAERASVHGVVLVNLIVDAQGMPQNVHVVRSLYPGLDQKAIEAVKQYRFRPAKFHGKPVPVELNVEVSF